MGGGGHGRRGQGGRGKAGGAAVPALAPWGPHLGPQNCRFCRSARLFLPLKAL